MRLVIGRVGRRAGGVVLVEGALGASEVVDPGLGDGDGLVVVAFDRWMVALGEESRALLTWDVAEPSLRVVAEVARLELSGYDPGGLRRMIEVGHDSVLVETEVGMALVCFGGRIAWQRVHGDLTARVTGVDDGVVEVRSESGVSRYAISDVRYLGGEPTG
ncbi:hypothetical protein [Kribbella sp. NPDC050470]|uniref:hypothetical protein n=1 Tax=unclassified Kribbella TaxID=2644121 RepID=UPI0037A3DB6F